MFFDEQTGSSTIRASQHLPEKTLLRLPPNYLAEASQYVELNAKSELAKSQIDHLTPIARKTTTSQNKMVIRICIGLVSALTFSAGTQILTSRLGKLSLPAALLVGSIAGLVADEKVTQLMTKGNRRKMTEQGLDAISQQSKTNPPTNQLGELYYKSQKALIYQLEGDNLIPQPAPDIALAVILTGTEYACSLLIIMALGGGGLALEMLAAGLPVAILWTVASQQSNFLEMPEHAHDLIYKYDRFVLEPFSPNQLEELNTLSDQLKETQKILEDEAENQKQEIAYKQAHNQRKQEFITKGDASGRLKNWTMAEADFDIEWYKQQIRLLSNECNEKIEQRKFKHRSDENRLIQNYRSPIGDYSPQEINADREQWLNIAKQNLAKELEADLEMIKVKHDSHIENCKVKITQAEEKSEEASKAYQEQYKYI